MNSEIALYLSDIGRDQQKVSMDIVKGLLSQLDFNLPEDYLEIMQLSREWEGEIGSNSWLLLFPLEDLIQINADYQLMEEIPEYFLIGKDSSDTGFALHKFNHTYHAFGLMSNFDTDPIDFCGNNLTKFLRYLYNQE